MTHTIIRHNDVSQIENIQDEYKDKNKSVEEENDKVIVRVYSSACARHANHTTFVFSQKIELEKEVRDKEGETRKLESELAHLNKQKSMHEALWTTAGKAREEALKKVRLS